MSYYFTSSVCCFVEIKFKCVGGTKVESESLSDFKRVASSDVQ